MKQHLIAMAVAAAISGPALAQNLVISGGIQAGLMNANTAATSTAGVAHLGNGANALNINSSEDLGGGLTAGWTGQIRFNAATGDINSNFTTGNGNALFHNSNVFISSKQMGTVRVGRIAEESNCAFDPWGCGGGAALMGGIGNSNDTAGVSALVGAGSQANSVRLESITWNGLRLSYQQSVTGPLEATRTTERKVTSLTYASGPLSAQWLQASNGANTSTQATVPLASTAGTDARSDQTFGGARYNLGFATVGYGRATTKDAAGIRTAKIDMVTAVAPLSGPWTLLAGWVKNANAATNVDTKTAVGVNYSLSKRTTLGADLFQQESVAGSTGYVIRAAHTF